MNRHPRLAAFLFASAGVLAALPGCSRQGPATAIAPPAPATVRVSPEAGQEKPAPRPGDTSKEGQPPADRGTRLVGDLLAPSDPAAAAEANRYRRPLRLPAAPALERPQLPLPRVAGDLPRVPPAPSGPSLRPGALPEGLPLARYRADPPAPKREELPALGLVHLPSPDVNTPDPLPILARPVADRAPLGDPTPEVSVAAVLAQPVPVRTKLAPFVRVNLPDPFEHAQAVRLPSPPPEGSTPPIAIPRPPAQ